MKENVYVIWVETRLGHIDDNEEDMETEVELYEIVDCLETAKKEVLRLNQNNLDHWNVEFWYSEEPLIKDTSEVNKEIYLTTPENYDYIMTLIENNKKLGKEIERLNNNWNELEQWCLSQKENDKYCYLASNIKDRCRYDIWGEVLDKLKELKGVDKSE